MSRAVSTVVDVTLFLLFVGAATAAVVNGVTVESPEAGNPADDGTELLATSTATVEYQLRPAGDPPPWTTNATARHRRSAHGSLAELLGEAAMSRVSVDGARVASAGTEFEAAVANTTRRRLHEWNHRSAVRARWEPYRGAPVNATLRVGQRPPPSADVRAATLRVPSPTPGVREEARRAASASGYDGVARVVAGAVVEGLFPPDATHLALEGDYPSNRLARTRYRRMGALVGAGELPVQSNDPAGLNDRVTDALAVELREDLRDRFDSPAEAASSVESGTIRVTVRTWSQ